MLAIQPRIFHKGLILLFVPLLFELIVAITLISLQHYYGEAVKAEALRKQIVFHINQFWYYKMNVMASSLVIFLDKGLSPDWGTADSAFAEYTLLSNQLKQDPQQP